MAERKLVRQNFSAISIFYAIRVATKGSNQDENEDTPSAGTIVCTYNPLLNSPFYNYILA